MLNRKWRLWLWWAPADGWLLVWYVPNPKESAEFVLESASNAFRREHIPFFVEWSS